MPEKLEMVSPGQPPQFNVFLAAGLLGCVLQVVVCWQRENPKIAENAGRGKIMLPLKSLHNTI